MVRGIARLPAAELLELPQACAGNECGCRSGVDAAGMVLTSGAGDCSVAGSARPGKRSSYERARSCRWKLALACPRRHANNSGFSMAAGFDGEFEALSQSRNVCRGASGPRSGESTSLEASNLEADGRLTWSFKLPRVFSWW